MHEDKSKLVTLMNNYGVDNFQIKPTGDRDEYYPIIFLEPSNLRNQIAIGYDIYYESTRQNAVNMVKNNGDTTITGKIILVQEIDENIQNGFLMMSPIYSNFDSDYLQGITYAVFRIDDFVSATVDTQLFDHVELKIYDDSVSDENLFFNSESIFDPDFENVDFSTTITTSINNRNWVFVYDGVERPLDLISMLILLLIPIVGFSMSFLLFYIFRIVAKNTMLTEDVMKTEKLSAMGTMASRLSHDLRNPLTVIKSALQLLQLHLGSNMDEKTTQLSKRIEDAIETMSNIIEDVLHFSKTSELKKEKTSLNDILQSVISGIDIPSRIRISLPANDFVIYCDKSKMKSVFSNLITNAIQSIKNDGTVSIRVEENSDKLTILVVDSGPGIPKENISKLFEPLFTTKSSGTGLGLVICKNILEQHGGSLSVKNNPTTFSVIIPKK
jgi:signal transduction histidine kinase